MSHDRNYKVQNALEAFVFLLAHELHHLSGESNRWRNQLRGHSRWRQSFEFKTQQRAWETVLAYRAEARSFMRLHNSRRRRVQRQIGRQAEKSAHRKSPAFKLQKMEQKLERWRAKLAQAQRYVKKYQTSINRSRAMLEVAEKRRAASPSRKDPQ